MEEITGINHIGIRVSNLDTARKFYEKLGFKFIAGPIGPEPVAIMEHASGININFILNADSGITNNILMDVIERHPGYTHTEGPITLPNGGIMFFIRDQDKNVIEFHQNA